MRKLLYMAERTDTGRYFRRVLWMRRALWKIGQMYDCIIKGRG